MASTTCPGCWRKGLEDIQDELPMELMRTLGAIPSYYLRYYYASREVIAESASSTRVAHRR